MGGLFWAQGMSMGMSYVTARGRTHEVIFWVREPDILSVKKGYLAVIGYYGSFEGGTSITYQVLEMYIVLAISHHHIQKQENESSTTRNPLAS